MFVRGVVSNLLNFAANLRATSSLKRVTDPPPPPSARVLTSRFPSSEEMPLSIVSTKERRKEFKGLCVCDMQYEYKLRVYNSVQLCVCVCVGREMCAYMQCNDKRDEVYQLMITTFGFTLSLSLSVSLVPN